MIAFLIVPLALVFWVACARVVYARIRPYSEPLNCRKWIDCRTGKHDPACYRRFPDALYFDKGEAVVLSVLAGILWPVILPFAALGWAVVHKPRQLPAEVEAKTRRLERELEELRRKAGEL